eukprot:Em0014g174a
MSTSGIAADKLPTNEDALGTVPKLPPLTKPTASPRFGGGTLLQYRQSQRTQAAIAEIVENRAAKSLLHTAQYNRGRSAIKSPSIPDEMISAERKIRLNYEFLRKCVAAAPVPPMATRTWEGIIQLLPRKFLHSSQIQLLREEITSKYEETIRKMTVQLTLVKPAVNGMEPDKPLYKEQEGLDFSTTWRDRYEEARRNLLVALHITHPVMQAILALWQGNASSILVDFSELRAKGPLDIERFCSLMTLASEKGEDKMMTSWYPKVINLFSGDQSVVGKLSFDKVKMERFNDSVSTLLGNQISNIITRTMEAYALLFHPENTAKLPLFKLQLCLDGNVMQFFPSVSELQTAMLSVLDTIKGTMRKVPLVQAWLSGETAPYIQVSIDNSVLKGDESCVIAALQRNLMGPTQHMHLYDKYSLLISGDAEQQVVAFLQGEHSLEEFKKEIERFRDLAKEISGQDDIVHFDMFTLECHDIKRGLSQLAQQFADKLLGQLAGKHREQNERICQRYEEFNKKALAVPQDSQEIMELISYMETARNQLVRELYVDVEDSMKRLRFLLDMYLFTGDEIELNQNTLMWPKKLDPIFEENEKIVESAKTHGERALTEKQEKVNIEIEKCYQRAEKFSEYNDLTQMLQYCKDVASLQKRLTEIQEQIVQINKEEALFKWTPTTYPQLDQIHEMAEPYQKLFSTVLKWQKAEKKLMDGLFTELNAENTQAEVEEFGREIYKLQKTFTAKLKQTKKERDIGGQTQRSMRKFAPLKLTAAVTHQVTQFKEHFPVIQILCNPGLRQRHWDKMSEIVGFTITPDSGTSLRKMLKHNLGPFLDQFESISGGASKEYSLEKAMQKMVDDWDPISFNTILYRETGVSILTSVDDIQTNLDDQIVKTQTMRGSPFIKPFEEQIKTWEEKLLRLQDIIDDWLKVQAQWLYLEPIFSSEDIMQQMPEEGKLFLQVDKMWKDVMKNTVREPKVLVASALPGLLEKLRGANDMLDKIMKGLNAYLEKKRLFFPR